MITGQAAMLRVQIRGKNMYYAQKIKEDEPIRDELNITTDSSREKAVYTALIRLIGIVTQVQALRTTDVNVLHVTRAS